MKTKSQRRIFSLIGFVLITLLSPGCAPRLTPEQVAEQQKKEQERLNQRLKIAEYMSTVETTGKIDKNLYSVWLYWALYENGPMPGVSARSTTSVSPPATTSSGGYSSSNPVMVIQPKSGTTVIESGGITTYQSPGSYCLGGYGVTNCY